uniref:Uncharacterized protein n=1 Tax=Moumouvirus sp. 'Monve' TaxID=1128131 RepID=H2EG16_9VIRU|nr:hypothetical protein mv_L1137 [Moumouvirus Monve]
MLYFFHGASYESFKNIIKTKYIYASLYIDQKYLRSAYPLKYVFTNIYVDNLPLREDEKAGFGAITFIIDPIILKYRTCYFNIGWDGDINKNTIIMNNNVDEVLDIIRNRYRYPYITTHEALFRKRISIKFVTGVICEEKYQNDVRKYLDKHKLFHVKIFNKFPKLIS